MVKNQILSDTDHRSRWEAQAPLARALAEVFTWSQLQALGEDFERWVDWTGDDDPEFNEEAPDGAELLSALLHQALIYSHPSRPLIDVADLL